ncbi:MAG: bifunctional 3,4-dihydroxy-2-butanone-4-phosphate synthase/GTP cyclohydrolase II [Thiotrichales bacterium]|nr:bifunctional 3,4-dihydroxy-2-butanone-4-phosphate synthase/GTP cyclohydrolase II [Thiotrichales bacterium]MCY4286035.1 bifunctional 3,4-dihydroxy-2-butanone-4-phosphate synthase/GTP cyclohydrolase II [Thiotrichales bacterium]
MSFDSIDDLITEFRNGNMVVLVDDEDRENEGDLVMPAVHVTPEAINFMARYGRGLICLPMTRERCDALGLKLMVGDNREAQGTQFTVSIDAAHGISTGISAADRAETIHAAVRQGARPSDFVQPGHIFPLMSEPGGVLTRAGHTEAGCDLARLAGLEPAAVVVEILNEDGTMARRPDLERFAEHHGLKVGTIADLIKYRMLNEKTVERVGECRLPTEFGEFRLVAFRARTDDRIHYALVAGAIEPDTPALVRVHIHDSLYDLTGSLRPDAGWPVGDALRRVAAEGHGVVVVLRPPEPAGEIIARIDAYRREDASEALPQQDSGTDLRTFGLGAQILADLGVRRMRVLSAPKRLHALSGFGLEVVEYVNERDPAGRAA